MQDIGQVLQTARNERKIDIEQACQETNIARRYLEALETGMYEVFPGEPYIVGFLRNYAEYLGLNPNDCVTLYKQAKLQETSIPPDKLIPKRQRSFLLRVLVVIGALLLVAALFYVGKMVVAKIDAAVKRRAVQTTGQTKVVQQAARTSYTLSQEVFEKRLFKGDILILPIGEKNYKITVEKTAPKLYLATDIGTQIIELGQSLVLDLTGNTVGDMQISVEDIDQTDESKGALVEILTTGFTDSGVAEAANIEIADQTAQSDSVKYKVLFDAGSAYPVTFNATFRSYCLFRYEQDKTTRDERYYQKSEQLTVQANNGIRIWASNGNAVKMQIIAGGKTIDLDVGRQGKVIVQDLKWLKDDKTGRYKFVVIDLD